MRNNGANLIIRSIIRPEKRGFIIPLSGAVRVFEKEIELLDPDACNAISEKRLFLAFINDALDMEPDWVVDQYRKFLAEYEGFGIDKADILPVFRSTVYKLTALFADHSIIKGPRYKVTWRGGTRDIFIYEED